MKEFEGRFATFRSSIGIEPNTVFVPCDFNSGKTNDAGRAIMPLALSRVAVSDW